MEAEKVLNFYDWLWYQRHILKKEPTFWFWSNSEANPDGENGVKASEEVTSMSGSLSPTSKLRSLFAETTSLKEESRRKSLTELEFEEVKGFEDLGFVFSEEDRNSSLASVIPGLNKLGLEDEEDEVSKEPAISRPYLSEVWGVLALDRRRDGINPLLKNWKLPCTSSEIDMKQNLRWWAQIVASTVR